MAVDVQRVNHPEMSRPYFEREMRLGARVIFQWNEVARFGHICSECHQKALADGTIIQGAIFTDSSRAAAFDLDFIRPFDPNEDENWTTFRSWADAEDWLHRGG